MYRPDRVEIPTQAIGSSVRGWPNPFRRASTVLLLGALIISLLTPSVVPSSGSIAPPRPAFGPTPGTHSLAAPASSGAAPLSLPAPLAATRGWINVTAGLPQQPPMVLWDSLTYDPVDGYALLFGGCTTTVCPMPAQSWSYSNASWQNLTQLSAQPPARSYAMMAFDGADGYPVLFGGVNATTAFNDTWSYARGVWTDRSGGTGAAPPPRWGATLAYDPVDGYLVLFGGSTAAGVALRDTWTYATGHWTNITASAGSPPARFEASMVWDAGDQEVVLSDGCGATSCPLNDTWDFQGGQWSDISGQASPQPPARYLAMMSYDRAAGFAVLFGGYTGASARSDTWTFQNNRWTNLTPSLGAAPPPRGSGAVMEDTAAYPASGEVVLPYVLLFGGDHQPCPTCAVAGIQDTWVFESPPTGSASFAPGSPESGAPVTFTASASGGTAPYAFAWEFGDNTTAVGASAVHAFLRPGTYDTHLTTTDAAGAVSSATVPVTVLPGPTAVVSVSPTDTDVGVPVTFQVTPAGGVPPYTLRWAFGDGAVATTPLATHSYAAVGAFSARVVVQDSEGGLNTSTAPVTVHPTPVVTVISNATTIAMGSSVLMSATVAGGVGPYEYSWQLGDGTALTGQSVSHLYESPGKFAVTVVVTDAVGGGGQNVTVLTVQNVSPPASSTPPSFGFWVAVGGVVAGGAVAVAVIAAWLRRRPPGPPTRGSQADRSASPTPRPAWDEGL